MKVFIRFLFVAAIFPFLFLSQSCEKIKDEVNKAAAFDATIDLPTETIVIDSNSYKSASALLEWKVMKEYGVTVDIQQILDDNNVSSASLSNGVYESADVTIIAPPGVTFSFTTEMYIAVSTNPNFDSEIKVAETGVIPPGSTAVTFTVLPVDITSLIDAETFYIRLYSFKIGPLPTGSVTLNLDSRVTITIEPL